MNIVADQVDEDRRCDISLRLSQRVAAVSSVPPTRLTRQRRNHHINT